MYFLVSTIPSVWFYKSVERALWMAVSSDPGLHFQVREILGTWGLQQPPSLLSSPSHQPCEYQYLHIGFLLLKPRLLWVVGNQIVID